ncbi:Coproporphyrinogen oxidase [Dacryopinax primogenitus]|uniref:coproporphyrinogen oxidase n=1 Tax=Dacryopinax primogenitus (strain DJM 731) TaxID=1858805 RepID=M5GF85_DACPD|nr:Coproporphyrinogen oxidase [Dacryopinax primogenitus]EJU06047.1 Coproporphyrinogen oxidase [Dacryopinax primogenitus]
MAATSETPKMRDRMTTYIKTLQREITSALNTLDQDHSFKEDHWVRAEGGMGNSCTIQGGKVFEKAGVNISVVHGMLPPAAIQQMRANHSEIDYDPKSGKHLPFFAAGISLVIHPRNPHAPTMHANYRYFEIDHPPTEEGGEAKVGETPMAWWFGGGCDLTPSYLYEEDAVHFHTTTKAACDPFGPEIYPLFKKWCDEYFYITHRQEARGLGGIFFDDLSAGPHARIPEVAKKPNTPEEIFAFIQSAGNAIVPSYLPIVAKRKDTPYTDEQRRWQLIRRGRYVEFNLVYDRGTKFGLQTPGARIESILMSLPETARWEYMSEMGKEGTEEGRLMALLTTPRDWA